MKKRVAAIFFPLAAVAVAAFVLYSSLSMPRLVASHFDSAGLPNGFMPRYVYVCFMLGFVIGLPVLMVYMTWFRMGTPGMSIKVPNREHWMAPVRRDDTIAFLRERVMQFGVLLLAFMGYGHWLVVRANLLHPAILDQKWFISGVVFFLVATIIWIRVLMAHFRNPD